MDESRRDLAKANQRLLKNIKRRLHNLNKQKYGLSPAVEYLTKQKTPMYTKGLTVDQLKAQKRDLMYFQSLKTSYVRGVKNYSQRWSNISKSLEDKDWASRFSSLYNRFVEEHAIMSHYKYEVYELIAKYLDDGASDKVIHDALETMFNDIQYGGAELKAGDAVRLYYVPSRNKL